MKVGLKCAVAATAAAALIAAGCGSDEPSESGSSTPEDAVESYVAAGQDGDGAAVCDLLTADSVKLLEQFSGSDCADVAAKDVSDLPKDFEIGDAQIDGDSGTVTVTGDGDELDIPVTNEDGEWKIDLTALSFGDTSGDTTSGDTTAP